MVANGCHEPPSLQFTGDLVPNLVDKRARLTPDTIYAEYPVSTLTYDEGYRAITYRDFANAVNGAAHWLVEVLGLGEGFETLAYLGPNDLRYPALILGAVKAGYKLFLTSPRNSEAAQLNLFDRLDCKTLLSSSPRPPAVTALGGHSHLRIVNVPEVSHFLDNPHGHFTFDKSWPEARSEPLLVVHTSGSTGMPKPLLYTHATAATNTMMMALDPPAGYESQDRLYQGKKVFIAFPPFHGAYLVSHLFNAVSFGTIMIAPSSSTVPSGEGLVEALGKTPMDVAFIVPSIVQDLAQSPELLDYCSNHLELILYCGGDLPRAIGDIVASKIRLLNQFGASELGLTPNLLSSTNRAREDWKYAQFHPGLGLELHHIADGIHELYAVRDPEKKHVQPTFTIFPDAQEYASRDLFVRHPAKDKSDLWSWQARADDIIVFLNGEKTNPISMEQYIVAHSKDISAALVIGAQRFQAALLIEPIAGDKALDAAARAELIEKIWPTIEEANKDAPSHARVMKSHILFTRPQKRMLRTGKGTVQRSGTLRSFASEINALYKDADSLSSEPEGTSVSSGHALNAETVSECVRESVISTMEWSSLDESANFFGLGMDSLHALALVRRLRRNLVIPTIAPSTVYTNPSISSLTAAILRLWDHSHTSKVSEEEDRVRERNGIVQEYKKMIDNRFLPKSGLFPKQKREIIILTGSTGNLGSYILDVLLRNLNIAHIYCLNRAKDSLEKQVKKNRRLGLQSPKNNNRVSFLTVDLSRYNFNLTKVQYDEIVSTATLIIHNAWSVNFNLSLSSFRLQLDNLVNLLDVARSSRVRFFYISSISSLMSYRSESGKIPEQPITADSAPGPNGYAESKYVAEQIINHAAQVSHSASLAFARVGQLAGAANHLGMWNKDEWFPSMILSSVRIGALPDTLGPKFDLIDWVPIDLLADTLVELALKGNQSSKRPSDPETLHADVYHLLNPLTTTWPALRAIVLDSLKSTTNKPLEIVPLRTWIAKVRKEAEQMISNNSDADAVDLEAALRTNPAAKLLDFYEGLATSENTLSNQLETSETLKRSEAMRKLEPIKEEWVIKWIREWFDVPEEEGRRNGVVAM